MKNKNLVQIAAAALANVQEAAVQKILEAIKSYPYRPDPRLCSTKEERFSATRAECFETYVGIAYRLEDAGVLSDRDVQEARKLLESARSRIDGFPPPASAAGQSLIERTLLEFVEATRLLRAEQQDLVLA